MAPLKTNFRVSSRIEAFYTGGKVHVSSDGKFIFCTHGDAVNILDSETGKRVHCIKDEGADEVTCFAVTGDDEILVVAYRNTLLKQWDWKEESCTRTWQSLHRGPVVSMAFDVTSTLLATGSSDSTIKLWDIVRQYCTHNLKGSQGVVSLVQFHPDPSKLHLFSVSDDNHIRVWDLQTSSCTTVLASHYGAVTGLALSPDGNWLVSSGRDSVVVIWDLDKGEAKKTIPVFEPLEAVMVVPKDSDLSYITVEKVKGDFYFITAGAKGILKVWSSSGRCLHKQEGSPVECFTRQTHKSSEEQEEPTIIIDALLCQQTGLVSVVTYDHNIILFGLEDLALKKQFVGYNEEILDLKLMGNKESHLAVASNSEQIRVFDLGTGGCQILIGHTDIVLALDVFKQGLMLVSSSKDNTVRLWSMNAESQLVSCVAVGLGHTHSVGAVTTSRLSSQFCVSGSEDCTIKVWKIPDIDAEEAIKEPVHLKVTFTEKAHDKDINSVCMSPNDKLLATGSQDRVAKLWHLEKEVLLGSFRGHRRGIWCVQFSPTDQALATSSADGSIKIWALSDFSCVKTFEGHDASVLKVIFLTRGMQLLSSGSDGLLKLWTIKTSECLTTLDEHSDKVWSVATDRSEQRLITAGADSNILIWEDVTQIEYEEKAEKEEDQILKEQQLSNLLHSKKFTKALRLAIILDQPFKALGIIKTILEEASGEEKLKDTLMKLRPDQIEAILKFSRTWNTNSKHCHVAQTVINIIMHSSDPDDLAQYPGIRDTLEGLLPYTDRHLQRLSRLVQQAMFVEYTWQVMRRASGDQGLSEECTVSPDSAQGVADFFVGQRGNKTVDDEDDASDSSESNQENKDEMEEETKEDGEEKGIKRRDAGSSNSDSDEEEVEEDDSDVDDRTVQKTKEHTLKVRKSVPKRAKDKTFLSTPKAVDKGVEESKEKGNGSKKGSMKRVLTQTLPIAGSSSSEEESDDVDDDDGSGEDEGRIEMELSGDEDGMEVDSIPEADLDEDPSLAEMSVEEKRARAVGKRTKEDDDDGDEGSSDVEDEDQPPSPVSRRSTRQLMSTKSTKVGVQLDRASKRKGSTKAVLASGTPAKKTTPSPYTKKLRRPSRK